MTTIHKEIRKCSHCGCKNEFVKMEDTCSYGPADLDSREAGPARELIMYTIDHCKSCNFCNENIEEPVQFDDSILTSSDYLKIMNSSYPEPAKNYMMASMIKESRNNYNDAAAYMLCACWILDDNNIDAKKVRIVAARLFEKCFSIDYFISIAIDLYRRAEEFERAKLLINKYKDYITDKFLKKLLRCEDVLIDMNDSKCHDCSEIENLIGESEELEEDSIEEIQRKLFDPNCNEPIYRMVQSKVTAFEQVAIIPIKEDGEQKIYAILHPETLNNHEAIVFELVFNHELEDMVYIDDEATIAKVNEEYQKMYSMAAKRDKI